MSRHEPPKSWDQGRDTVLKLLRERRLQRVPASRAHAEMLLDQARGHLRTADAAADDDPVGAYQLTYNAARKALCAILENQGLRQTSVGGHLTVVNVATAQLDPPQGAIVRSFDRMRRRRNMAEYPGNEHPMFSPDEVRKDIPHAQATIDLATNLLDRMPEF